MSELIEEPGHSGTAPEPQHAWLQKLVGDWRVESEMVMGPDQPVATSVGSEKVTSLGGLWAFGEGSSAMPNGTPMDYKSALGYDVSQKAYRGCWFASASSHLWKYEGVLSEAGRVMTLSCVGPDMEVDGKTANYRDVIEIIDDNHRTLTSYGEDENGNWVQFVKATYTRV